MAQPRWLALMAFGIACLLTACDSSSSGALGDEPVSGSTSSAGASESAGSQGSSPSSPSNGDASSTSTESDETVAIPRTVDASGFCADIDRSGVESILGSKIVQQAKTEPGEPFDTTGQAANGYACFFASSTDFNKPRLSVAWSNIALFLSEMRKARAQDVAKYGCRFADLPGVAPEDGFIYTCPNIATRARSKSAEILVAIAVGKTVFGCNLFAHQRKLPASPSTTASFCIDQLEKMAS